MKLLALLMVLLAQAAPTPAPTPTPDWHVYQDKAMYFRAPDGFFPVGQRTIDIKDLGDDPEVVAAWIYPKQGHERRLAIQQEYFEGDASGFEGTFKSQLRGQYDSTFFRDETHTTLKNGMPAMFMEMTTGEGFNIQKIYFLVWADGQRGVAIGLQTQLDDINEETARQILSDVTAVRYPIDGP